MNISLSKATYKANGVMVGRLVLSEGKAITKPAYDKSRSDEIVLVWHGMNEPPGLQWCRYGDLEAMAERGSE